MEECTCSEFTVHIYGVTTVKPSCILMHANKNSEKKLHIFLECCYVLQN
jgi:hypothetical protein